MPCCVLCGQGSTVALLIESYHLKLLTHVPKLCRSHPFCTALLKSHLSFLWRLDLNFLIGYLMVFKEILYKRQGPEEQLLLWHSTFFFFNKLWLIRAPAVYSHPSKSTVQVSSKIVPSNPRILTLNLKGVKADWMALRELFVPKFS